MVLGIQNHKMWRQIQPKVFHLFFNSQLEGFQSHHTTSSTADRDKLFEIKEVVFFLLWF